LVENYQTVVIVGETGCGKSTQIPQVSIANVLPSRLQFGGLRNLGIVITVINVSSQELLVSDIFVKPLSL
jgi:ABC-type dipeptide/oligopeptide/nickel transport system ATPase component